MKSLIIFTFLFILGIIYANHKIEGPYSNDYKIGDCIALAGNEHIYKIVEVGKYGLKTIKPYYNGYEEVLLDANDIKKSTKMDCFDSFNKAGEVKND